MRHGCKINHLSRTHAHRVAMLSNMATSLPKHSEYMSSPSSIAPKRTPPTTAVLSSATSTAKRPSTNSSAKSRRRSPTAPVATPAS